MYTNIGEYNPKEDLLTSGGPEHAATMSLRSDGLEDRPRQHSFDNRGSFDNRRNLGNEPWKSAHARQLSATEVKSNKSACLSPVGSDGVISNKSRKSIKSNNSRKSEMTRNPLHYDQKVFQHIGPGIDDRQSHIYREFDHKGRMNQNFYQRAALAGIKNLETNCFRKDSPIGKT